MYTRLLPLILLAGVALPYAAARAAENAAPGVVLSSADTMEKVFCDEPWTRPAAAKLAVQAARNEWKACSLSSCRRQARPCA